MDRGRLISFEGGEGSGKTTQSKILYEYLQSRSIPALYTREIGGTALGEQLRDIIINNQSLDPLTELMMIIAARNDHIKQVIQPALDRGSWVICDRFIDSTAVYQTLTSIPAQKIYELHIQFFNLWPDLTLLLDVEAETAVMRLETRPGQLNRFDQFSLDLHRLIRQKFLSLVASFDRIKVVDGNQAQNKVTEDILNIFNNCFSKTARV